MKVVVRLDRPGRTDVLIDTLGPEPGALRQPPPAACVECGDDDPTEGHVFCMDCLERLHG